MVLYDEEEIFGDERNDRKVKSDRKSGCSHIANIEYDTTVERREVVNGLTNKTIYCTLVLACLDGLDKLFDKKQARKTGGANLFIT